MPTGYTDILDSTEGDVPLNKFIWRCARAFGAFIMARDEPMNKKLDLNKLFEVSSYEKNKVKEAKEELARIASLTPEQCRKEAEKEYREELEHCLQRNKESRALAAKYDRMKKLVSSWVPPTADHLNLKKFMLEQLDTGYPFLWKDDLPEKPDPRAWYREALADAKSDLERAEKDLAEEIKRQNVRKKWVKELIDDLGEPC